MNSEPMYSCQNKGCADECTYPADMLRVYEGAVWCEDCWLDAPIIWLDDSESQTEYLHWSDLDPFVPDIKNPLP